MIVFFSSDQFLSSKIKLPNPKTQPISIHKITETVTLLRGWANWLTKLGDDG